MQNILLSSIFRKLPLKLLLVILAVVSIFIACTKADDVVSLLQTHTISDISVQSNIYKTLIAFGDYVSEDKTMCFIADLNGFNSYGINIGLSNSVDSSPFNSFNYWDGNNDYLCFIGGPNNYLNAMGRGAGGTIDITFFILNDLLDTGLPILSSLECQTEYNLIPIEEVDSSYCQSNNLCPSGGSPSDCPNVGVSNLFINDIFHPGAFNVIMNIPEEIDWDYAYTNSGSNINIDVVGYNQDTEYINGLIDINNYKPTSDDFNNVFGLFKQYSGLLIACLFVILVFYLVKKSFK